MAKVTKLFATVLCGSMILTGCGSTANSNGQTLTVKTESKTASSVSSNAEVTIDELGMKDKNTFDSGTTSYTFDGLTLSIPSSFTKSDTSKDNDYLDFDISDNNELEVRKSTTSIKDSSDKAIINSLIHDLMIYDGTADSTTEIRATNIKQFTVGDLDAVSFEATIPTEYDYDGTKNINEYITYIINSKADALDLIRLTEKDSARYTYKNDYYKIVNSIKA